MLVKDIKIDLATIWGIAPIVFVIIYASFSFYGLSSLQTSNKWVQHTQNVIFSATELEKLSIDMETGERGFLLTGQQTFLEPYTNAKDQLFRRIIETKTLVSDNPEQVKKLIKVEQLIEQWLREIAKPEIDMRKKVTKAEVHDSALKRTIMKGEGKIIFDKARSYLDELNTMFEKSEAYIANNLVLSISKRLVDQETGQRGFLLTGDINFLQPYNNGKKFLNSDIESLNSLIDQSYDRQVMAKNLKLLKTLGQQWQAKVAAPAIQSRKKINLGETQKQNNKNSVADVLGKEIFDKMRATSDEMTAEFARSDDVSGELNLLLMMKAMVDQETGLRGFLITSNDKFLEPYQIGKKVFSKHSTKLGEIISSAYKINLARRLLDHVSTSANLWDERAGALEIDLRFISDENNTTIRDVTTLIAQGKGLHLMNDIRVNLSDFKKTETDLMHKRQLSAEFMSTLTLWANAAGSALIIMFSFFMYRTNREMQASSTALELQQKKLETQSWIKSNAASITENLAGADTIENFSETIMHEFTPKIGAHLGVFYQVTTDNKNKILLKLSGSYAFDKRKNLCNEFSLGDGLVGQCGLEKKTILLENAPEDYIHINSGTGEAKPANIIVFPLLHKGELQGVVEFASVHIFTETHRELIEQVSSTLGVNINNLRGRKHTEKLLLESQEMSEKLQIQQEELQAANETLEEQTQQLKASEEELNVSNEELVEKQDFLQLQKDELSIVKKSLEQRAEDLQLASKYKTEFLANMSHELRTPLNSMLILSKMLTENKEGNLSERQQEDIKVIHDGGKDLLVLINDIMDLSKVEAGMLSLHEEDVNLKSIINSMEGLFAHVSAQKSVAFKANQEQHLPSFIYSDGQRVEQILKNFLSNAFKFTSEGSVTLNIHTVDDNVQFTSDTLHHNSTLAFSVTDTGIGIPEEKQQAIFESFQQEDGSTSRKYGGTGLGLSISKELARLLGGEVMLRSELGKGSTFTLYLPYSLPGATVPAQPSSTDNSEQPTQVLDVVDSAQEKAVDTAALQSITLFIDDDRRNAQVDDKTILIIEDDPVFAKLLLGIIRDADYKGLVTNLGRDGLYLAMHYRPNGILLDVGLPDIDGMAVLDQLKFHSNTKNIPVHVISGRDNNNNQFLTGGAISFLQKPIDTSDIESILSGITDELEKNQQSVLLIEDNEGSRKAIERLINSNKAKVVSCSTGAEAITVFKTSDFDCVILDLGLPDMSGYEILEYIAELPDDEKPPVIVYTGQEITDEEEKILAKYTSNIIIKGLESPERLLDDVSLFLHRVTADAPKETTGVISTPHNENAMLKDRKVLLVDDDMRNLFALSRQLEEMGLEVEVASNGKEAIDTLNAAHSNANTDNYELILMDIMMPVMDGYEAMQKIRLMKPYKDVPIIALTAKAMQEDREKCISAGASEYLTKPIDVNKLASILRVWLYKTVK